MEPGSRRLRLLPHAVAQVIEGEAIVINLENGVYYSLEQAGALAWELLASGTPADAAALEIARRYDVEPGVARRDVNQLAALLLEEGLCEASNGDHVPASPPAAPDTGRAPYHGIKLQAYRDMSELLALDPPLPGLEDIPLEDPPPA